MSAAADSVKRSASDDGAKADTEQKKARLDAGTAANGESSVVTSAAPTKRLRIAVVCSSNQNRSMEAHEMLRQRGFNVESYGSGSHVKIPGPSIEEPNVYEFGEATYDSIYKDLLQKDPELYHANGMLEMVDRNRKIKLRPERFQDEKRKFDVVVTCEERVFDQVTQGLEEREQDSNEPVHVCNVEIKDTRENAAKGAVQIVNLCEMLDKTEDLDDAIETVLEDFEQQGGGNVLHGVAFY